jgi:hypothetical protein
MKLIVVVTTLGLLCVDAGLVSTSLEADGAVNAVPDDSDCIDSDERCELWADAGECSKNPGYMLSGCAKACNVCPSEGMDAVHAKPYCVNEEERCPEWAQAGECAANPSYMVTNCAKACRTCHLLDPDVRKRYRYNSAYLNHKCKTFESNNTFLRLI